MVHRVAAEYHLKVWSYISTAGILSEERARWLGEHIDQVSLSTDGPPAIQNSQRPLRGGAPTAEVVERTARVLREIGANYSVRCTITRHTVHRQMEILIDLHTRLGAQTFSFEPAYRSDPNLPWTLNTGSDAARFVDHFLAAQKVADALGCTLETSGVRLDEIHGPYCNVLRDVLQLTPDGAAVSCFVCTDGTQPSFARHRIGHWDAPSDTFILDPSTVETLRASATAVPNRCVDCHNIYHCARECPDACPIPIPPDLSAPAGFRCNVQRVLGHAWILNALKPAAPSKPLPPPARDLIVAARCLAEIPESISAAALAECFLAAAQRDIAFPRRAPDPIWAIRGFDMDGTQAWREISGTIAEQMPSSPISIYIHVPFCDRKCDFCDCYSIPLEPSEEQRFDRFTDALLNEIHAWARFPRLRERPVTTIHFGGGTPTFLPIEHLRTIINALKSSFKIDSSTEIAFESTSTQLSPALFEFFCEAGITRLHVGVQTLDDPIRKRAGRKEPAAVVEEKLRMALASGLTLTVDVIYGLPGQTISGLVDTLTRLNSLGVHGFSLYRLNLTRHNQPFARDYALGERSLTELFFFFQIGEALLRSWNYRKTHFAHFSKPADRYLYYRHTHRGEDLLALGPSADGVFGSLHYRNPEMRDYLGTTHDAPPLMGAAWETATESRLQPAVSSIMTSSLKLETLEQLGVAHLMDHWIKDGLLAFDPSQAAFELTATGSWLIADMLAELM